MALKIPKLTSGAKQVDVPWIVWEERNIFYEICSMFMYSCFSCWHVLGSPGKSQRGISFLLSEPGTF